MSNTVRKRKASSTHRKVRTTTARNRKTTKRPSAVYKEMPSAKRQATTKQQKQRSKQSEQKQQKQSEQKMQKQQDSVKVNFKSEPEKSMAEIILGPVQILPDLEQIVDSMQPQQEQMLKKEQSDKVIQPEKSMQQQQQTQQQSQQRQMQQQTQSAIMDKVNSRVQQRKMSEMEPMKLSASEIKEQEIKKAIQNTERVNSRQKMKKSHSMNFGLKRFLITFACTAAAVFAIAYFVNLNTTDVSIKVAAMQSGIDASYPKYVPRDYTLSDITSEDGKITLNFKNSVENGAFTIIEERSSWDSNTLLNNYVKGTYGDDYTVIKEKGLTLYIGNSSACWANGGVIYKLNISAGSLTKKQMTSIAVSFL